MTEGGRIDSNTVLPGRAGSGSRRHPKGPHPDTARDGARWLLTRRVFAEVPPRVEYELTPLGQSLHAPIEAITDWAEANVNKVMAAREAATSV